METTNVVESSSIEREIEELEQRFWQSMKDKDVEACSRLSDFPTIVAGPQGVAAVDEQAFAGMMQMQNYELHDFALSDFQVRALRPDVAVASYKAHLRMTVEGEPLERDYVESSTWIRGDGGWRCAAHSEALVGDPFGRAVQ